MRAARGAWLILGLGLIGVGLCAYLFYLHLGQLRGEFLGGAICSGSGVLNCHAVTAGRWGAFLGLPLPLWGLIGYVSVITLALLARQSTAFAVPAMILTAWLAAVFLAIDAVLLGVMAFVIRFYCVFCLLSYAVNLFLFIVALRFCGAPRASPGLPSDAPRGATSRPPVRGLATEGPPHASLCEAERWGAPWRGGTPWPAALRQVGGALAALAPSRERPAVWLGVGMVLLTIGTAVGLDAATTFVSRGPAAAARTQMRQFIATQPRVTVDVAGDPALGPTNAPLTIVEFSDLFCPSCQRASKVNTVILANHRQDVFFTFKHFPLDQECNSSVARNVHPGACRVAAASECAHRQGRFWAFHDLVFEAFHDGASYQVAHLEADAQRLGLEMTGFRSCLESGEGMEAVKRDIAEGLKANVRSTPTYVVNGVAVTGGFTPSSFEEFIAVLQETATP